MPLIIIFMQQQAKGLIKPFMILSIASVLLTLAVIVTMGVRGYLGLGQTYTSVILCNSYLIGKYQVYQKQYYAATFITSIFGNIFSIVSSLLLIGHYWQIKNNQQGNNSEPFIFSAKQLNKLYICVSSSIFFLIATVGYYISLLVQKGRCLNSIYLDWTLILILSLLSLILLSIIWIKLFLLAINRPQSKQQSNDQGNNIIGHQQLRQMEQQINNIFEMEGASDMYKTVRPYNGNNQHIEPLLYQNNAIPIGANYNYQEQQNNQHQSNSYHSPNARNNANAATIGGRKLGNNNESQVKNSKNVVKKSDLIQKKKQKFRQLISLNVDNGRRKSGNQQDNMPTDTSCLPGDTKTFGQYLKEMKRPRRASKPLHMIMMGLEGNQSNGLVSDSKTPSAKEGNDQDKKLKQIDSDQSIDIEFIDELANKMSEEKNQDQDEINKNNKKEELFYHKPKMDRLLSKTKRKRKMLFEEEIIDVNRMNLLDEDSKIKDKDVVIINKLKEGQSAKKANKRVQTHQAASPSKKLKAKTSEQMMVQFLKKKYVAPPEETGSNMKDSQLQD